MSTEYAQIWFVVVEGKRYGPFSVEQIQNLLRQGNVRAEDGVLSESNPQLRMTVRQLVDAPGTSGSGSTLSSSTSFSRKNEDPALGLFDLLQVAKVRTHQGSALPPPPPPERKPLLTRKTVLVLTGATIALGAACWSLRLISSHEPSESEAQTAQTATIQEVPKKDEPAPAHSPVHVPIHAPVQTAKPIRLTSPANLPAPSGSPVDDRDEPQQDEARPEEASIPPVPPSEGDQETPALMIAPTPGAAPIEEVKNPFE